MTDKPQSTIECYACGHEFEAGEIINGYWIYRGEKVGVRFVDPSDGEKIDLCVDCAPEPVDHA